MERYEPSTYGDEIADVYDEWHGGLNTAETVSFLAAAAGTGPVLELAVGTGRVAIPLVERGLSVHGVDASVAMVERLRAKRLGDQVIVTMGDMADVAVDGGPFS